MKPFKFKFQKILDYKIILENNEKHKFAKVLKKYMDKETTLNKSVSERENMLLSSRNIIEQNDIELLRWRDKSRIALKKRIGINEEDLNSERSVMEKAREELLKYTMQKKIYEKLKERDMEKHKELEKREIKKQINDITQRMYFNKLKKSRSQG